VDVGAVYDESKQLFDHHQRGFTEIFGHGFQTKLSSAGLVYKCVLPTQLFFKRFIFCADTLEKKSLQTGLNSPSMTQKLTSSG